MLIVCQAMCQVLFEVFSSSALEVQVVITSRRREVKLLSQDHTASEDIAAS